MLCLPTTARVSGTVTEGPRYTTLHTYVASRQLRYRGRRAGSAIITMPGDRSHRVEQRVCAKNKPSCEPCFEYAKRDEANVRRASQGDGCNFVNIRKLMMEGIVVFGGLPLCIFGELLVSVLFCYYFNYFILFYSPASGCSLPATCFIRHHYSLLSGSSQVSQSSLNQHQPAPAATKTHPQRTNQPKFPWRPPSPTVPLYSGPSEPLCQ